MTLDHPWTTAPAPADVVTLAPGIGWLRMPLPFQLNHINLWLLDEGAGWTIVDTGVGLDDTRAAWARLFASYLGGRPVTRVLVTHFHPDHMGNASWLATRWQTEVWCTQAEWLYAQLAWRSRGGAHGAARARPARRHSVPARPRVAPALRADGGGHAGAPVARAAVPRPPREAGAAARPSRGAPRRSARRARGAAQRRGAGAGVVSARAR